MRRTTRFKAGLRWGGLVLAVLVTASCAGLEGPVTGNGGVSLATGPAAAQLGYQESEYFLTGHATAYTPTSALTTDGKWQVAADPSTAGTLFKTRLVVLRPVDPAKFNGTVVVEWLNVTAGVDFANDWISAHNELVRSGAAWVGVSAQAVGVNALKSCCNARYGSLLHPGDSFSYDMFSQAGQAVRDRAATVLGGLIPQRVLAAGESQSASRLVTYIDAVQPIAHVYDGFLVHSRGAGGSALSQTPQAAVAVPTPSLIRDDLTVPVMEVQSETDVINSNLLTRQPDTAKFREWEMAGTSHADLYMVSVGYNDPGDGSGATQMFSYMRNPPASGCASPTNAGGHHWILQAAIHGLDTWVRTGTPPAVGPLMQVVSSSPVVLARDAQGNALGGVRSPQVDAPVATLTGINDGASFCRLFGSTTALTTAQLSALYPTHADFVSKWLVAVYVGVVNGFLLPADVNELNASAMNSTVPN